MRGPARKKVLCAKNGRWEAGNQEGKRRGGTKCEQGTAINDRSCSL